MNFYWNSSQNNGDFTNQMIAFMQSFSSILEGCWPEMAENDFCKGGSAAFLQPDTCSFGLTSSIQFMCLNEELMYPAEAPEDDLEQKTSKVIQQTEGICLLDLWLMKAKPKQI